MTSLSGLEVGLGIASVPSVGHAQFDLFLSLPMAIGVALSGVAVSVSVWDIGAVTVPVSGSVSPSPPVGIEGDNSGSSEEKATRQRTGVALVDSVMVSLMLVVILVEVQAHGLPLGVGLIKGHWLNNSSEGQRNVQNWSSPQNLQLSYLISFKVGRCVQHYQTERREA